MSNDKVTLSQLEQYLSKAAWILKGPVDAADFKVYIFPLLFFKRISDVYDDEYKQALEESGGDVDYASLPEFHRFIIPEKFLISFLNLPESVLQSLPYVFGNLTHIIPVAIF